MDADLPSELDAYLTRIASRTEEAIGDDLLGVWLIGSAAQGAYDHGVSDVDVLAISRSSWPESVRADLGARLSHPRLPCPAVGLEYVWYALPDLENLADPVQFQLNVNGGPERASARQLAPDGSANYWSVLDLAAARQVGVAILGATSAADVVPPIPDDRLRRAVRESVAWHDGPDAGAPNRVLNLARLLVLADDGGWVSKRAGAEIVRGRRPELAPAIDEAFRARAEKRGLDPALAAPLSDLLHERLDADWVPARHSLS